MFKTSWRTFLRPEPTFLCLGLTPQILGLMPYESTFSIYALEHF